MNATENQTSALLLIRGQIEEAVRAPKCHGCGCLHATVRALASTRAGEGELAADLRAAEDVFLPKEYDCLGCPVCHPAIAANAFAEAYPEAGARLDLCPTDEPAARPGWPPLPGDYHLIRLRAPVAVCTLNSHTLSAQLRDSPPDGLAIVGSLHTENLGIERVMRNVLANRHVRFLVICGEDTMQRIGHLPGQSFVSLFRNGVDEHGRIIGAQGKRPILKNVSAEEIGRFREQVTLLELVGELRADVIRRHVLDCSASDSGPVSAVAPIAVATIRVEEPTRLMLDPAGYFVVYLDPRERSLILEHYTNEGVIDCALEGGTAAALYSAAAGRGLVSRLDHAAYLGSELARAERSLHTGEPYVQDRAPGELRGGPDARARCGCSGGVCK